MKHRHSRSFDLFSSFSHFLPGWGDIFFLLLLLLAGAFIGSFVFMALTLIFPTGALADYQILIVYPIQFIPAMIYAASRSHAGEGFDNEGIALDNGHFKPVGGGLLALMTAVGTIACAVVAEPVCRLLPDMPQFIRQLMEQLSGGPLWVALLSTAVFAPFFEEWLCRGVILRGLLRKYSPAKAIIISALIFALIHLNPWQAIPAFILGCLFGLVYFKTGSLKLTMLMHCANNAFSVILTRIPATEGKDYIFQAFAEKWQYGIIYMLSAALLALLVTRLLKTSFE